MPTSLHHDDTPLGWAWARYKAQLCEWAEVQAAQNSLMPRCIHNIPTATTVVVVEQGERVVRPICAQCIAESETLQAWLRSHVLISGGVWQADE